MGAVSVDNRIFIIGGGPEPRLSVSDDNEIYILKQEKNWRYWLEI